MRINKLSVKLIKEAGVNYNDNVKITSPNSVTRVLTELYDLNSEPIENLVMLMLDTKNKVIGTNLISKGTVNSSLVSPREIIQTALLGNAVNIILAHNHPSGNSNPSQADIDVTKRLNDACNIVGINLLDHIVIGDGNYTSLKEYGIL